MDRRPMIAANWKMHKTISEAIDLTVRLKYACDSIDDRDVVLCPPYPSIQAVSETLSDSRIEVGAQNMHYEDAGAFTGEVSPPMVEDAGAEWVILGHSERRQYFNEDSEILTQKLRAASTQDLKVFYCIGESEEQRDNAEVETVLHQQLHDVLEGFNQDDFLDLVVAYEPIWAIGTGNSASPDQANEAHSIIRDEISELFDDEFASTTRIVYGGSVKPHNVEELMDQPQLDGALVGSASLSSEDFSAIVKYDIEEDIETSPM